MKDRDNIEEMYARARRAFREIEFWPQEKVDEMVAAAGWEWQKEENRKMLAKLAVEESEGIGIYEDKVAKIRTKVCGTLRDQLGAKTCGLVKEDTAKGLKIYAKPMGVVAVVVPCTQPGIDRLLCRPEPLENTQCHDRFTASTDPEKYLANSGIREESAA